MNNGGKRGVKNGPLTLEDEKRPGALLAVDVRLEEGRVVNGL